MNNTYTKRNVLWASLCLLTLLCCFLFIEGNLPLEKSPDIKSQTAAAKVTVKQPISALNPTLATLLNQVPGATNVLEANSWLAQTNPASGTARRVHRLLVAIRAGPQGNFDPAARQRSSEAVTGCLASPVSS